MLYMCISQLRVQSSVVDTRTITCVNGYYTYTFCSVGISDLKPLTGTSADQLPHRKSQPLATA